jgi:hypothetical protein
MSDILEDAQKLFVQSMEAMSDQRRQIEEDLRFSDPSDPQQWEEDIKRQRENDPGGKRPCLVHDQTGQYVANVAGQVEKTPPSIHAIPVGGSADKQAAEQMDGRFRHIEHESRAMQHYQRALTNAARVGVGYLTVRPEYLDRSLNYQEPRISSESDVLRVVVDPWSNEMDGSDMDFGYVLTAMSISKFQKRWPNAEVRDFGDLTATRRSDDRKSILVAEQWVKETKERPMLVYVDQSGEEVSGTESEYMHMCERLGVKLPILHSKKDKYSCVKWRMMSGATVLETFKDAEGREAEWPSEYIGIVPVYGYVGYADGRLTYCGIPRRARASQQAYNYHRSEMLSHIGTAPKSPWIASVRAISGLEPLWDRASVDSRSYLPYHDQDAQGVAIPAPHRTPLSMDLRNHSQEAEQALRDLQASIGMYQANIGAQSNVVSGVAYDAQKQQGEASTAHFPSHLSASLGQVGRIVMQMDAKLSDTRRKQPIIGIDQSPGHVFVDPEQQEAFSRTPDGVVINPNVGKYGVRVVVGASYATQRKETNSSFTEMMRANPAMAPIIAPFWAQTLDFPGSDKFAQAVAAMAPPPVKAILQPEGSDQKVDPAAMAQQVQQLQQALQEAIQHAQDAQQDADMAIAGMADAKRLAEVRERENDIKAYDAETKRLSIVGANEQQIQAVTQDLIEQILRNPTPLPGDMLDEQGNVISAMPQQPEPQQPDPVAEELPQEPVPNLEMQALLDNQNMLASAMAKLIEIADKPRKRTAVRDPQTRELLHVLESVDMGETQ